MIVERYENVLLFVISSAADLVILLACDAGSGWRGAMKSLPISVGCSTRTRLASSGSAPTHAAASMISRAYAVTRATGGGPGRNAER